jgi:hypothetical protein
MMSSTASMRAQLADEGLRPSAWSNGPTDRYAVHRHGYDKVIVVTRGSITFVLPEMVDEAARESPLATGDRLDLPAEVLHGAIVGGDGVECLEAHLPPGSLDASPVRRAGWAGTSGVGTTGAGQTGRTVSA